MNTIEKAKTIQIYSPKIKIPRKGHTIIELRDKYTGEKEVFEDDNMMTNALEYYFANLGQMNYLNDGWDWDWVIRYLGGIMMFDTALTEDADNILIPNANMVANGAVGQVNNGDPAELGSYAENESGWQQDGSFVQVYDYSTGQGNGTIACACLTSQMLGGNGCGNLSNTRKGLFDSTTGEGYTCNINSQWNWATVVDIDIENGYFWYVETANIVYNSSQYAKHFNNTGKITVHKATLPIGYYDLKKTHDIETIDYPISAIGNTNYWLRLHLADGAYVNYTDNDQWSSSSLFYVLKINRNGYTKYEVDNLTGESLYKPYDFAFFYDGYMIVPRSNSSATYYYDFSKWFKIKLSDSTVEKEITTSGLDYSATTNASRVFVSPGIFVNSGGWMFNVRDGKVMKTNCNAGRSDSNHVALCTSNPLVSLRKNSYNGLPFTMYRSAHYIASINNLETPVVKTSAKTMKVTYRITF